MATKYLNGRAEDPDISATHERSWPYLGTEVVAIFLSVAREVLKHYTSVPQRRDLDTWSNDEKKSD